MPIPAKKNEPLTFYCSLSSVLGGYKEDPTIAIGDFKVSIDGGAFANLVTLPVVTPAGGQQVKVSLSAAEMNGDNISVQCSDVADNEWVDVRFSIPTATRQLKDLAFPTITGRSLDITAGGTTGIDWSNIENKDAGVYLSSTNIDIDQIVASVSGGVIVTENLDKTGYVLNQSFPANFASLGISAAGKITEVSVVTGLNAANLDAAISSRSTLVESGVRNAVGMAAANLDTQIGTLATPTNITEGSMTTVTNLTNAPTAGGLTDAMKADVTAAVPTADTNADALLDRADAIEVGWTIRQIFRVLSAAIFGKASGAGTPINTYRNLGDTKDRLVGTVDDEGNRTGVTVDKT